MKSISSRSLAWCVVALVAWLPASPLHAEPETTQTFLLQPGWNAIYLEVRPEPNDTDTVFGGLPLASAWTWNPEFPRPKFIEDPTEELIQSPAWQGYFPLPRPEAVLTNLFAVQANRAYLLKIDGDVPVPWTVHGKPQVRDTRWGPDAFNLVGFPVDPAIPPTFANFLAASPAHAGQPVFRLINGSWQQVNPATTSIRSGESYWVYCKGPSDYTGPIEIDLDLGTELAFGGSVGQAEVRIRNRAPNPVSIRLTQVTGPSPLPLQIRRFDADTGDIAWPMLPLQRVESIAEGGELLVNLAPKRADFTTEIADVILEVRDGFGYKKAIAISAKTAFAPTVGELSATARGESRRASSMAAINRYAGLWVGRTMVRKVSEAQDGSLTPVEVKDEFSFRVILHVDAAGTVRLLKEVIQLWKDGTLLPDPENPGSFVLDEPGHYVLVTNESLVSSFDGAVLRDGEPVGLRVSTIAYDFPQEFVVMSGSFAPGGSLSTTLVLDSESPTNPFLHSFHPDHDNLDARFVEFKEEAYAVTRSMTFALAAVDPLGTDQPGYGEDALNGVYQEILSGLHRNDIAVEGFFSLRRASGRPYLNQ